MPPRRPRWRSRSISRRPPAATTTTCYRPPCAGSTGRSHHVNPSRVTHRSYPQITDPALAPMRADRILGWPAACSMVWPTSPGAMACSRRVRIAGEGRLELRIPERVAEGHHRLPDRLVHEHATAGDAAVELGGDEAW